MLISKEKCADNRVFFTRATLKASYAVSFELAKAKKPLSDGEIVTRCAVEMAKAFGDDNMAKNFETVSLSRRTATQRIFDIQNHVEEKLKQVMHDYKYFLALDESTDVMDVGWMPAPHFHKSY